jgi:hypothetical protein
VVKSRFGSLFFERLRWFVAHQAPQTIALRLNSFVLDEYDLYMWVRGA